MSQMRARRVELRAIFAAGAICVLVFSLLVSSAAQASHVGASYMGASYLGAPHKVVAQGHKHAVTCHHAGFGLLEHGPSKPSGGHPGHADCPGCCLAAHSSAAVLPGRLATFARPPRIAAAPILYSAFSTNEPETAVSSAVNGARAPPARLSTS